MSKLWPPPPDIDSIQELVATADIEGFIADGAPADEYETEADDLFAAIQPFATCDITAEKLMPEIEKVWIKNFSLNAAALAERRERIALLAGRIAHFFGPEAKPQVRGS